jgi:hypothetical protein
VTALPPETPDDARRRWERVTADRRAQGLPDTIVDPTVLDELVALLHAFGWDGTVVREQAAS